MTPAPDPYEGETPRGRTMNNRFQPEKFQDHKIVTESGEVVGHVRVKPSSILWAPKAAKVWYGLSLAKFGQLMVEQGRVLRK